MSIIHRYRGTIDAPYPEDPSNTTAIVFSDDRIGFVKIPLRDFPQSQRESLRDGDRIKGRVCPRSSRAWVVK